MHAFRERVDFGVCFSATEDSTEAMGAFMPKACIYNSWRPDVVEAIMTKQAKQWKRGHGSHVAIVCDDVFFDK